MPDRPGLRTPAKRALDASQPLADFVTKVLATLMIGSTTLFAAYALIEILQPGKIVEFLVLRSTGTLVLVCCIVAWLRTRDGSLHIPPSIPGTIFTTTIATCTTLDTWMSGDRFEIALGYSLVIVVLSVLIFRTGLSLATGMTGVLAPPLMLMYSQHPGTGDLTNFIGLTATTVLLTVGAYFVQREVIVELLRLNENLVIEAGRDDLTGLMNRRRWSEGVAEWETTHSGMPSCILYMDLDEFKSVNDRRGHDVGDRALKAFARLVQGNLPQGAMAARFGGDEFVVFIPGERSRAESFIGQLHGTLRGSELAEFGLRVSIGVAQAEPGIAREDLLRKADQAMLAAKSDPARRLQFA